MNVKRIFRLLLLVAIVTITAMATPALAEDMNLTAVRSLSTTDVHPGDTFTVTVVLECTGSGDVILYPGFDEEVPYGWTITTNVTPSGYAGVVVNSGAGCGWQEETGTPMSSGESRTFVYDVTVNSLETEGDFTISGLVTTTVDGTLRSISNEIDGQNTVHVTPVDDSIINIAPGGSIQDAIDDADSGDTIVMAPGTYYPDTDYGMGMIFMYKPNLTFIADGGDVTIAEATGGDMIVMGAADPMGTAGDATGTTFKGITFGIPVTNFATGNEVFDDVSYEECTFASTAEGSTFASGTVVKNCNFTGKNAAIVGSNILLENSTIDIYSTRRINDDITVRNCSIRGIELVSDTGILIEDCTLNGNIYVTESDAIIRNNEFLGECTYKGLAGNVYLNNFINYTPSGSATFNTPEEVTYTYRGIEYTGYLGNYYSNYAGNDSNSDGVGEEAHGSDTYPLMSTWDEAKNEIESDLTVFGYEVTLINNNCDPSSIDSSAPDSWNSLTDLGALMATGVDINASYSSDRGTFEINDLEGLGFTSSDWAILIDGEPASMGLGGNSVSEGSIIEFYAPAGWTYVGPGAWDYEMDVSSASYCIRITVHDDSSVKAIRTIETQTFDSITMKEQSTLVTIEFEVLKDLDSLALMEEVPEDWVLTPANKSGAEFRAYPDADDAYEWIWYRIPEGNKISITYIIQAPDNESVDTYNFTGSMDTILADGEVYVEGINVDGDDFIEIEDDWNPWDNIGSDNDEYVTSSELRQAINCWLYDEPAPTTGARITTYRLQLVISQWIDSP